jgi:hypothetical protein
MGTKTEARWPTSLLQTQESDSPRKDAQKRTGASVQHTESNVEPQRVDFAVARRMFWAAHQGATITDDSRSTCDEAEIEIEGGWRIRIDGVYRVDFGRHHADMLSMPGLFHRSEIEALEAGPSPDNETPHVKLPGSAPEFVRGLWRCGLLWYADRDELRALVAPPWLSELTDGAGLLEARQLVETLRRLEAVTAEEAGHEYRALSAREVLRLPAGLKGPALDVWVHAEHERLKAAGCHNPTQRMAKALEVSEKTVRGRLARARACDPSDAP